ncbi:TetR/AcrR family transcriptional regulator [Nocardia anaemiae]|uniref:TetR/AcrR family transcriptional regulator n=1 Tax=Nocardia anaemiae TaxID=263910 RepID=UPI0007A46DE7|nr:TetR/AcrR family transcriptional regulator [Nocardia anaemiae]
MSASLSTPAASGVAARADARRNRALVLAAAQRAFAEHGTSVSLAEVARRAGVGAGTVYRHFPTKTDLLEAVMQQRVDRLATLAAEYLDAPDPGAAFFAVCTEVVISSPRSQALCDIVQSDDGWPKALLRSAGDRFHQALGALLTAAQRQGAVRADIEIADVLDIFTGCVTIQRRQRPGGPMIRAVAIMLDAMRANPVTKPDSEGRDRNETGLRNETPRCPICRTEIHPTGTGRPARYCSAACRQKAHRQRTARAALR